MLDQVLPHRVVDTVMVAQQLAEGGMKEGGTNYISTHGSGGTAVG